MGIFERFKFGSRITGTPETIVIDINPRMSYQKLAIHNAASLIANAICGCEWNTYEKGEKYCGEDYYRLNVSPNPNQNASQFWHKCITKLLEENEEVLIFETSQGLFCADSFSTYKQLDISGDVYSNIKVGNFTLSGTKHSSEVIKLKLESCSIKSFLSSYADEESELIRLACNSIKNSKGSHYKFKVHGLKQGDETFAKEYTKSIANKIKKYLQSENGVYVEYDGYELVQDTPNNAASVVDYQSLKDGMIKQTSIAYKIPLSLMTGESRTVKEVIKQFMTFAVKPYIRMIEQAITKYNGYDVFQNGYYVRANTTGIMYHDIIDDASNINYLISSGTQNIDEVRGLYGDDQLNTEWSQSYWMTKNYDLAERVVKEASGGGG